MKRLLPATLAALTLITQSGCATTLGGPLVGVVIDATTGKPVPGAFAIATTRLTGSDGVGSRSSCVDLDVSEADSQGRYRLSPGKVTLNADRVVMAYAPGYVDDSAGDRPDSIRIAPFKGTPDARDASFTRYLTLVLCGPFDTVEPKLRKLFGALDAEYATLALTRRSGPPAPFSRRLLDMRASRIDEEAFEKSRRTDK